MDYYGGFTMKDEGNEKMSEFVKRIKMIFNNETVIDTDKVIEEGEE